MELEVESDNDNVDHSKIELTKAEAEAIDRGLQVLIFSCWRHSLLHQEVIQYVFDGSVLMSYYYFLY